MCPGNALGKARRETTCVISPIGMVGTFAPLGRSNQGLDGDGLSPSYCCGFM